MKNSYYPIKFIPIYKDYPWGGSRIPETYNRKVPSGIYAESWEISDHDDGMSVVANGALEGKSLREILEADPGGILGRKISGTKFPLLIKLIDSKQKLSVQVHPNDETAARFGGEAKTEMWYLLGENKTQVYCGLHENVTKDSFLDAVKNDTSGDTMRPVPVEKDSAVFVRGGRVHAIDEGCLILEIQQNSNTTYRIYDWGRMGNDGNPRELHIDQAVEVINWDDHDDPLVSTSLLSESEACRIEEVLSCEYFRLEKLTLTGTTETQVSGETFHALFVSEGALTLSWDGGSETATAGESILIPAALPAYSLAGEAMILRTTIP